MFLNIAALPVLTITIRRNMMKLCVPHLLPKDPLSITPATGIATLLILAPCITLAMRNYFEYHYYNQVLRNNIDTVVSFTGGVCGVMIMLVLPSMMILKAR